MVSSDSASNSILTTLKNSKNYGGAAVYEYKSKYIAKHVRNTLLSPKQLRKKRSTLTEVRDT